MDLAGLVDSLYEAVFSIDFGRKGFATRGKAEEGRLAYGKGLLSSGSNIYLFFSLFSPSDPVIISNALAESIHRW